MLQQLNRPDTFRITIDSLDDDNLLSYEIWGHDSYSFSNNFFQERIINDLNHQFNKKNRPVRIYSEEEALKDHISPDLVINLRLLGLQTPNGIFISSSRSEVSRTFAENTVYPTNDLNGAKLINPPGASGPYHSTQTVTIMSSSYFSYIRGAMELNMKSIKTGSVSKLKAGDRIYEWNEDPDPDHSFSEMPDEYKTLALEKILDNLYRKFYPQIKSQIKKTLQSREQ